MKQPMTSMERTLCTLGHQEPDRVPLFLLLSLYGARESGLSVKEYFSKPENVIKTQIHMKEKYANDCFYTFFYAALEIEAWKGEVYFTLDGPPNSAEPFLRTPKDIDFMEVPDINRVPGIQRVLEVTRQLKTAARGETPIIGVVMSPFSLPVMQLGFEAYLNLLYFDKPRFDRLMKVNRQFCISWANAQLDAGATAICYFNPLASPDMVEKSLYLSTGYPVDQETLSGIKGPTAPHLASGNVLPVMGEIIKSGCAALGIGSTEDIVKLKDKSRGKITLLGNLNGIEMTGWNEETAFQKVRNVIQAAGPGGGFILSDSHGEIPWQVPEEVLLSVSRAVREWGRYPVIPEKV